MIDVMNFELDESRDEYIDQRAMGYSCRGAESSLAFPALAQEAKNVVSFDEFASQLFKSVCEAVAIPYHRLSEYLDAASYSRAIDLTKENISGSGRIIFPTPRNDWGQVIGSRAAKVDCSIDQAGSKEGEPISHLTRHRTRPYKAYFEKCAELWENLPPGVTRNDVPAIVANPEPLCKSCLAQLSFFEKKHDQEDCNCCIAAKADLKHLSDIAMDLGAANKRAHEGFTTNLVFRPI